MSGTGQRSLSWSMAWRLARRDLTARLRGLRLLVICLFLGTGALAAIGTLTAAIENELQSRGQELLGGDIEASVWQRDLSEEERAFLSRYGQISGGFRLQAIARAGENTAPIELKAVDEAYPLYGRFTLTDGTAVSMPGTEEAYLAQGALDRLGIAIGDRFRIGTVDLTAAGVIATEPDRLGEGFQLGPTVIVAKDMPARAGLTRTGSMFQSKYRVRFDRPYDIEQTVETIDKAFPLAGLDIDTRERASPGADRFVTRMSEFLTLVGLAALVIAGIGIGGGVTSYLDARRNSIATLKILGATSSDIARVYALQIGTAAMIGCGAGLLVGLAITPLLGLLLKDLLPVQTGLVIDLKALLVALAYGLLVALLFAATPLIRARHVPAMALMRSRVAPLAGAWRSAALPVGLGLAGIAALALLGSPQPLLTAGFLAGAAGILGVLALLGWLIRRAASKAPRPSSPIVRAALANLHRPGSATGALVTALGFGLAAFVLLAAVQTSLAGNISRSVPERAPDYFVLDIPRDRLGEFASTVLERAPAAEIEAVPTLRGQVIAYGDPANPTVVSELDELPEGAWGLSGERGLTYSEEIPNGNVLTDGGWWPSDYAGEPLVSVDADLAQAAGLNLGDIITVSVLGVERTARIASFRRLDWESMGFNYVFVFSPNALMDAPHNIAATIQLGQDEDAGDLLRQLVRSFPSSSVIEVGPILSEARIILDQVALAILAAAGVAVLAGIAVLLGAIAAARAARIYDTVILRVLGASRRQLLGLQLAEFGLLAAVLAVVALAIGAGLGWLVIVQLFEFDWLPDWPRILAVLGAGLALVLLFAIGASLPLLRAKPAQSLRSL